LLVIRIIIFLLLISLPTLASDEEVIKYLDVLENYDLLSSDDFEDIIDNELEEESNENEND